MGDAQQVQTISCSHYHRRCNIWAPCCRRWFCCHRGHDESQSCSTRLTSLQARRHISIIRCSSCKRSQTITADSKKCRFCSQVLGQYFCSTCRMWDRGPAFHCSRCGICQRGNRYEVRHCDTCNMCYSIHDRDHACTIFNDCALCKQPLRGSTRPTHNTPCGHPMHESCFISRVMYKFSCPIPSCGRAIGNINDFNRCYQHVVRHPNNYQNTPVRILCNSCHHVTTTTIHNRLGRCSHCGSHNTRIQPPRNPASSSSRGRGRARRGRGS